jgi:tRNA-2-methylthio-N6-dimethylallyladenosine synthase
MHTYHIWTIGCQMNRAESVRMAARFDELGYKKAPHITEADLIVLNTCVVRQSAETKIINKLREIKHLKKENPNILTALTGCFVSADIESLKKKYPFIDHFFKAGEQPPWLDKSAALSLPIHPPVSEYVTISQGCNNFCAYCIVPYRRGRERSRSMEEILCEAEELARRGVKEIILLGQNVDSYGRDLPGKPDLADLLVKLNKIEGIARLRFLTNHPKDMSAKLIETIARLDKVCEQITLPAQAGSDAVLKTMRRGYTAAQYCSLAAEIREKIPGAAISTDIIVGFPGETDEQFRQTLDLLSELKFDTVHIAAYSPREWTIAARELTDDVPAEVKKARQEQAEKLQEEIQTGINAGLMGQTVEILAEGRQKSKWYGRTRTDKLVFFNAGGDYTGRLVKIKIDKTGPWSMQGIIESE